MFISNLWKSKVLGYFASLLSNFERIDLDSIGFKGSHLDIINNIEYELILDYNFLKTIITKLHG